jgi:hypothetical protein
VKLNDGFRETLIHLIDMSEIKEVESKEEYSIKMDQTQISAKSKIESDDLNFHSFES